MWIDFRTLKKQISLQDVLAYYGIVLRGQGQERVGPCPIHHGDNHTAFHVNLLKNCWYCHTHCGGGDVIDFVAQKEQCTLHEAAQWLVKHFGQAGTQMLKSDFTMSLSGLAHHPYLRERRITLETVSCFELKSTSWGVCIPLRSPEGRSLGILYRATAEGLPRYRFPAGFLKRDFLYGADRIESGNPTLVVVEGCFDLFRLFQAGFTAVVALLGSRATSQQLDGLRQLAMHRIVLFLDGDRAGISGARQAATQLGADREVFVVSPSWGQDPADLTESEVAGLLVPVVHAPFKSQSHLQLVHG